jgi:3-oxo-4-pregnene-20-carboxyl-CoA dehydrogenase beta subunit
VSPEVAETQAAVRDVVREALDRDADWAGLASAGLLSLPVPEEYGGEGLGLAEVAVLLHEVGSRAGALPVWETLCCGALVLAAAGSDDQQRRLLPGLAAGDVILAPAVRESGAGIPEMPSTTLAEGRLTGRKIGVTHAAEAAALLVPAYDGDRVVVALVDPSSDGVTLLPSPT